MTNTYRVAISMFGVRTWSVPADFRLSIHCVRVARDGISRSILEKFGILIHVQISEMISLLLCSFIVWTVLMLTRTRVLSHIFGQLLGIMLGNLELKSTLLHECVTLFEELIGLWEQIASPFLWLIDPYQSVTMLPQKLLGNLCHVVGGHRLVLAPYLLHLM